ncbi:glycosyltransferase 87 family protein [Novosphingobium subterraneum]|uniref:glycosyltransferase 87 family protein n=1 Tax=Novosphingobium subterraneum TaxID=48936 RepID=UPI003D07FB3E
MARRAGLRFEWAMAALIAAMTVWNMWHLVTRGYLPQPFFYESSDTWMDWFNTAWWAHDRGIYDSWASIYPPISFVVLRPLSLASCYGQTTAGLEVRSCDWLGIAAIHGFYLLDIVLAALAFTRLDRRTALPRSFALTAGMPLLYGLERGNLILLAFACMILAFGPLLKSARLRWLSLAVAINLKVYLVAALAAQLLRRRWRWFEGGAIAFVAVYLASFAMLGIGTPGEIVRNITAFSGGFNAASVLDVWYPATFIPMKSLLNSTDFPITALIGSQLVETGDPIISLVLRLGQASMVLGAAAIWFRPQAVPAHRATLLAVSLALITSEAGGYTPALILLFVMMERWEGWLRPAAIVIAYVLSLPGEMVFSNIPSMIQDSYFAGHTVTVQHGIGLGMFVRPILNILAPSLLAWHTIALVWRAVYQGQQNQPHPNSAGRAA